MPTLVLLAWAAAASACSSVPIEDAVPTAAATGTASADQMTAPGTTKTPGADTASDTAEAAVETGTYPNLNLPAKGATDQFTPGQASQDKAELSSTRDATAAKGADDTATAEAEAERLRLLRDQNTADALRAISGN